MLALLPGTAGAAPVYLKCQNKGAEKSFDVTVDEELGRVVEAGYDAFDKAQFTADKINYEHVSPGRYIATKTRFSIDRTTLSLTQDYIVGDSSGNSDRPPVTSIARCEVVKSGQRKI